MTVCIGALCNDATIGIVASDRMVTSTFPPIEFEHTRQKLTSVTNYCVILTAGNALKSVDIIPRVIASLGKTPNITTIAQTTKDFYQILRGNEAEELLLKPRTLTKEVFYTRGTSIFPPDLFNMIDHQFSQYDYGLQLLIVGGDNNGAHLFQVSNPGTVNCFDTLGFHAIGIGALHAIQTFIAHNYKVSYSLEEAINIVYAAKKAAEIAPGVGKETDISFIDEKDIIHVDPTIISEIAKIYDDVTKPKIEEVKEKSTKLRKLLDAKREEAEENEGGKDNKEK
jgi:hypothetical protein